MQRTIQILIAFSVVVSGSVSLAQSSAEEYANRGVSWYKEGDFNKAISDFDEALKINPQFAGAYNGRGSSWASKGEFDKALEDFSAALKINPSTLTPTSIEDVSGPRGVTLIALLRILIRP